jgi:hypothetical protein
VKGECVLNGALGGVKSSGHIGDHATAQTAPCHVHLDRRNLARALDRGIVVRRPLLDRGTVVVRLASSFHLLMVVRAPKRFK